MTAYEISVQKTPDYSRATVSQAVKAHFAALNVAARVTPESKVVLKPNLLMKRAPELGTTTHPALLTAVIEELRAHGVVNITIADSPGGPYIPQALESIYKTCGMAEAAKAGAKLNVNTESRALPCPEGFLCREFDIIAPVAEADLIINLPKLKTHAMAGLSGAVKNLFGCVPGLKKPELHFRFPELENFSRMLVELSQILPPVITIVDAVTSMEGDGPSAGKLRETGLTFASDNLYALDFALCHYIGVPPESIGTVRYAIKTGLSPKSLEEIAFPQEPIPAVKPFVLPRSASVLEFARMPSAIRAPVEKLLSRMLEPRPVVKRRACVGCKKCAESCAANAITFNNKIAYISREKCIRCYCCHEMCPVKAIGIRKAKVLQF